VIGMLRNLPSQPEIRWWSIRGGPTVWVAEGIVEYGDEPVHLIGIAELAGGKVTAGRSRRNQGDCHRR
jgi:hypothetical protein